MQVATMKPKTHCKAMAAPGTLHDQPWNSVPGFMNAGKRASKHSSC
jgi:hypothetical protein